MMPDEKVRDPRIDPRPGDVLEKKYQGQYFESRGYHQRRVVRIAGRLEYSQAGWMEGSTRLCDFSTWRRWAKNAEVIHHAG
jgi:hypothetical protein